MSDKKKVKYDLVVIGACGTGSYFLKEISRLISTDVSVKKQLREMYIIDGDTVEEKNLSRQAFLEEDIGRNKAIVMAEVLNTTYELSWRAVPSYITSNEQLETLLPSYSNAHQGQYYLVPIIIGCVDNHACRLLCEKLFEKSHSFIYFDSANEFSTGECVFAYKINKRVLGPCRSHYFPNITSGDLRNVTEISCDELNLVAPQHIFTNMAAGLQLCSAFSNLMNGNLTPGFTLFNVHKYEMEFIPYRHSKEE